MPHTVMCGCLGPALAMPGTASASSFGGSGPTAEGFLLSPEVRARAADLGRSQLWMDAHAHPGRSFLEGLPDDDPFVRLLGPADTEAALEDLAEGSVRLACFATVGDLRVLQVGPEGIRAGRAFAEGEAVADHDRQLRAIQAIASRPGTIPVRSRADLERVRQGAGLGVLISCEGADFLEGRVEGVASAFGEGARSITLVHYRVNELGDIQTEPPVHEGLSAFGAEVVDEMNRLGMVIDLAHATFAVTRDVLDRSRAPVMISHSHLAQGEGAHPRLLSHEHALAVTRQGGVVAAWPSGVALASFDEFLDEIMRMLDLLGTAHVAIGTDMDANYQPVVTSYRQFPDIAGGLLDRGLGSDEVEQVMGANLLKLFGQVMS